MHSFFNAFPIKMKTELITEYPICKELQMGYFKNLMKIEKDFYAVLAAAATFLANLLILRAAVLG